VSHVWVTTYQQWWRGTAGVRLERASLTLADAKAAIEERHSHDQSCDFCRAKDKWKDRPGISTLRYDDDGVGIEFVIRKMDTRKPSKKGDSNAD